MSSKIGNVYEKCKEFTRQNTFVVSTLGAVFFGLTLGTIFRLTALSSDRPIDPFVLRYLNLPGMIYIRSFMILIVPLLVTSLSTSFISKDDLDDQEDGQEDGDDNGKFPGNNSTATRKLSGNNNTLGSWITEDLIPHNLTSDKVRKVVVTKIDPKRLLGTTFAFFTAFSSFTITLGIVVVSLIGPGRFNIDQSPVQPNSSFIISNLTAERFEIDIIKSRFEKSMQRTDSIYNIALNIFPDNLVATLTASQFSQSHLLWPENETEILEPGFVPVLKSRLSLSHTGGSSPNMLGICVISLALGLILQSLGPRRTRAIRALLHESNEIVFFSMRWLMQVMPAGMFCWMFVEALKMRSFSMVAGQLAFFLVVAIGTFTLIWLVFYPTVYFLFTRRNPFPLYRQISSAILIAIGSCSSAITLPTTISCLTDRAGVSRLNRQVAQFVLPLGMTIHMNGTAMYIPMVAVFVAQMNQIPMDLSSLVILAIFALVMSMGLPASTGGGPMVMMAACSIVGIEDMQEFIAYFMTFDWIMERVRTATNVVGDCFAAKCIEKWLGADLQEIQDGDVEDEEMVAEKTFEIPDSKNSHQNHPDEDQIESISRL